MLTKKDFIGLADALKDANLGEHDAAVVHAIIADFCQQSNPRFNRDLWFRYLRGECGPSGGEV